MADARKAVPVPVPLPPALLDAIDRMVEQGLYASRIEALQEGARRVVETPHDRVHRIAEDEILRRQDRRRTPK